MSLIEVEYDYYRITNDEHEFPGGFSGEDTETSYEINGINIVSDKNYRDLTTSFDVKQDTEYLLLYTIFSTGDSFSRDYMGRIEFIDLFPVDQINLVKKNIQRIWGNNETNNATIKLLDSNGKEYKMHEPWKGFFEKLEEADYRRVKVLDIKNDDLL